MKGGGPEPAVRVGIVSWNTADLLDRCLSALPAALGGLEAEVVVVDNASSDGSADVAAGHPVTAVRNSENVGYARAMNQALAGATAPVLVALNPDTEPPAGSLERLVDVLRDRPDVGLVVPRLLNADRSDQHSVYRFPSVRLAAIVALLPTRLQHRYGPTWWLEGQADHRRTVPVDWAIGAVHCIRTKALDGSAPYSERWFMYVEDLELCWRLRRLGWEILLAGDVAVPHVGNASGAQAWGDSRTERWMDATYDWYAGARGPLAARAWAAVNTAGIGAKLVGARVRGNADRYRDLRPLLAAHGRRVFGRVRQLSPT